MNPSPDCIPTSMVIILLLLLFCYWWKTLKVADVYTYAAIDLSAIDLRLVHPQPRKGISHPGIVDQEQNG
ncbi:hypothetical protein Y032_0123g1175 [Ancylostoma ceylanicum]|uniref:Uncharacterized protein n=1 Tax=Ancylostoma ceylanicum TaxID=53326 RepID=A0A016T9M4_9BILA|nr:hypothetical protein Y032_0123g1175 [Ancylostoma ceylanicum]